MDRDTKIVPGEVSAADRLWKEEIDLAGYDAEVERLRRGDAPAERVSTITGSLDSNRLVDPREYVEQMRGNTPWEPPMQLNPFYVHQVGITGSPDLLQRLEEVRREIDTYR